MSSNHTPEPWSVAEESFDNDGIQESVIRGLDGRAAIAVTLEFVTNNPGIREANARRIVACVNALEGTPTDEIEERNEFVAAINGGNHPPTSIFSHVQKFHDAWSQATQHCNELKKQRDELLAVMTRIRGIPRAGGAIELAHHYADQAIAKAKGGAA